MRIYFLPKREDLPITWSCLDATARLCHVHFHFHFRAALTTRLTGQLSSLLLPFAFWLNIKTFPFLTGKVCKLRSSHFFSSYFYSILCTIYKTEIDVYDALYGTMREKTGVGGWWLQSRKLKIGSSCVSDRLHDPRKKLTGCKLNDCLLQFLHLHLLSTRQALHYNYLATPIPRLYHI